SRGMLKEAAAPQLTAAACVVGCLAGGLLACARWKSRRLLGGLAAGAVCYLLILAVGLLMSDSLKLGGQALIELAGCLCGGALAGLLGGGRKKKRPAARRK
ncbi:MAG: TIGR04086 family membrane protein, partial [Oscillospiraceae bacterium]|nr:TIGR04086 family membrane protein [Oscillospiraceae bacterium]